MSRQADLQRFLHRELVGRGHAACDPGHSPDLDARDARSVADLDHDSAPDGVISTTTCFISGWSLSGLPSVLPQLNRSIKRRHASSAGSLSGLLRWPIDNYGAERGENAGSNLVPTAPVRLCSEGERLETAVGHGFYPRFERERTQDHPIGTSDIAQQAAVEWPVSKQLPQHRPMANPLLQLLPLRSLQARIRH